MYGIKVLITFLHNSNSYGILRERGEERGERRDGRWERRERERGERFFSFLYIHVYMVSYVHIYGYIYIYIERGDISTLNKYIDQKWKLYDYIPDYIISR